MNDILEMKGYYCNDFEGEFSYQRANRINDYISYVFISIFLGLYLAVSLMHFFKGADLGFLCMDISGTIFLSILLIFMMDYERKKQFDLSIIKKR